MKIGKIAIMLTFAFLNSGLKASNVEEWPVLDLFSLVYRSSVVFTATPLESDRVSRGTIRRFVIKNRITTNSAVLSDTVNINWDHYKSYEYPLYDAFVFFGEFHAKDEYYYENTLYPILSGVRAFRSDTMFIPSRTDTNSRFFFYPVETITLSDFIQKTYRIRARLDSLLALRNIASVSDQNDALLSWAKNHLSELKNSKDLYLYHGDKESNWGDIRWEVFKWINGNGIWQDAWKGMMLSMEVNDSPMIGRPEDSTNAFRNPEARAFLYEIISETTDKNQTLYLAFIVLDESLLDPRFQTEPPDIKQAERQQILDLMIAPLAHTNHSIKWVTLSIIAKMFNHGNIGISYPSYYRQEALLSALKSGLSNETERNLKVKFNEVIAKMEQSKK